MRMWQIEPKYMCMQHILGEHSELHKHRHNFVKKHSIQGRLKPIVQIEPLKMKERHDELVKYLKNHNSPYEQPDLSHISKEDLLLEIDIEYNIKDLSNRCKKCKELLEKWNR